MTRKIIPALGYGLLTLTLVCLSINESIAQRGSSARTPSKTSVSKSSSSRTPTSSSRPSSPSRSTYKPSRSSSSSSSSSSYKPSRSSSSSSSSYKPNRSSSSSSYKPSRSSSSSSSSSSSYKPSRSSSSSSSKSYSSSSSSKQKTSVRPSLSSSRYSSVSKPAKKPVKVIRASDPPAVKQISERTLGNNLPIYPKTVTYQVVEEVGKAVEMKGNSEDEKTLSANIVTLAAGVELNELMVDESGNPITVAEAVSQLPQRNRDSIANVCSQQLQVAQSIGDPKEVLFWQNMHSTFTRPNQEICLGKSYGDPHMRTYDGFTYDLQAVGEFVLTKSKHSTFQIQSRQSPASSISLNTAAAMYVNGDVVTVYTQNFPDSYKDIPVRVNGSPLQILTGQSYGLKKGGVIRKYSSYYKISWPTGEQVMIKFFTSKSKKYMNILPQVYAANDAGGYEGLLGNADGFSENDLQSKRGSLVRAENDFYNMAQLSGNVDIKRKERREEVKYNKEVLESFGESWRVDGRSSLFEYPPGKSYYDFARMRKISSVTTLGKIKKAQMLGAKKACEDAGISDEDVLKTCILDVATSGDKSMAVSIADIQDDEALVKDLDVENRLQTFR